MVPKQQKNRLKKNGGSSPARAFTDHRPRMRDVVAPARNTMVSTGTTLIIVTVAFTFDNDVEFPHPYLIRDKKGKVRCYYRRSKPELKTCFLPEDAEEMDALFPLGVPPNLHISGESDEGDLKAEEE